MKRAIVLVLSLSLIGSIYYIYDNLNNKEDIIIEEDKLEEEFISYTLNGSSTDISYEELVENNKVNSVTCENGSIAVWNEEDKSIKLSNVNVPDHCVIDFTGQFITKILADNPTVSERTDFSVSNEANTTGTIYKTTTTEDGSTVYYYSGNTTNNWVKFGKHSSNGPAIGYYSSTSNGFKEYDTLEECNSASSYNYNCHYLYQPGDDMYWRIIRTNEDGSVRLLYAGTSHDTTEGYIGKSKFNENYTESRYVGYMYGGNTSLEDNRTNTTSSTIKTYIDNWYQNNLLINYDKYISKSAIYCNDRSVGSGTWVNTGSTFYFGAFTRLSNRTPTYKCGGNTSGGLFESGQAIEDKFSASTTGGGNGQLTYGVALMTTDEAMFAGNGKTDEERVYHMINSNGEFLVGLYMVLLSPGVYNYTNSFICSFNDGGDIRLNCSLFGGSVVADVFLVRPVLSIDSCAKVTGTGTPEDPYVIDEVNSTC